MKPDRGFDEVMIVNPYDPALGAEEGARHMRFAYAQPPELGYYGNLQPYGYWAEPPDLGYWSEYEPYGGYAAEPEYGAWAEYDPYGYYAEEPEYGEWGEYEPYGEAEFDEYDPYGEYAEEPEYGEWGEYEPYGYFAEEEPMGYYAAPGYGETPEMVGWGEYEPYGYYAEPDLEGYVPDVPSRFNVGCPMPTNVAGLGEAELEGYVKPGDVNPTCTRFTPQPSGTAEMPETLRPLW